MIIIFNNQIASQNQTITLFKNKLTYQIVCSSVNSNPNVNLKLYDTNSLTSLSTSSNSVLLNACNSTTNLCNSILQVNFQFTDNRFDNMTSLTCAANSSNPNIPLFNFVSRNVSVFIPGKFL